MGRREGRYRWGEEGFRNAIGIGGVIAVYGLLVHGFPQWQWARLDIGCVESHTKGLYVVVGLAVGHDGLGGVGYARCSPDSTGNYCL